MRPSFALRGGRTARAGRGAHRLLTPRALALSLTAVAAGVPAAAQTTPPRVNVSPSADVPANGNLPAFPDGGLLAAGGGLDPACELTDGHWLGLAGLVPGDIDAFARQAGAAPGSADSIVLSLLSDQGGFRDGDVLGLDAAGGLRVLVPEDFLAGLLGVQGTALDLDAVDFDDQGRLLFSLQSDLPSSSIGPVEDGDVLRVETSGVVAHLVREADVQACFTAATGSTAAILDVQACDWVGGELWVAVQSPSAYDGGVLSCGAVPAMVLEEADLGLGGAEIDALSVVRSGDAIPHLFAEPGTAPAGATLSFRLRGSPHALLLVPMAGTAGTFDSRFLGFGRWYFDRTDPWLNIVLSSQPRPLVRLDGAGEATVDFMVPTMVEGLGFGGESGWTFQAIDIPTRAITAPFRVEMQ